MLAEREEALEEADELDQLVTAKTESVQYDHPNHTVTVTTISDLDLSGARLLGLTPPEGGSGDGSEEAASSMEKPTKALPRKSRDPLLSQRISSLTASLHAHSRKKVKRKHPQRTQDSKKPPRATRTSKDGVPAPPSDRQSAAQRGVRPRTKRWPSLGCEDLSFLSLAVPVAQPAPR